MWKLYTGDHGIALVSNVGRLKQAFVDEPQTISIVNVEYRPDLETEPQFEGVEEFCRFKRSSFSHEQELRLVVLGDESVSANGGMYVAVDLAKLVDHVYVSPLAAKWIRDVVESEAKCHGLDVRVISSKLLDPAPP